MRKSLILGTLLLLAAGVLVGMVSEVFAQDIITAAWRSTKGNNQRIFLEIIHNNNVEFDDTVNVGETIRVDTDGGELNCDFTLLELTRPPGPTDPGKIHTRNICEDDDDFQMPEDTNFRRGGYRGRYSDNPNDLQLYRDSFYSLYTQVVANTSAKIRFFFTRLQIFNITLTPQNPTATTNNFLGQFTFTLLSINAEEARIRIDVQSSIIGNSSNIVVFPVGATSFAYNQESFI